MTAACAAAVGVAGCTSTFTPKGIPVIASFLATPSTIAPGDSATLSWRVSDADSLVLDHGIGRVATDSGSVRVAPSSTTSYILTAYGTGGTRTASVSVRVIDAVPFCASSAQWEQSLAVTPAAIASDVTAPLALRTDLALGGTPQVWFGGSASPSVAVTGAHTLLAVPPTGLPRGAVPISVAASPGAPAVTIGSVWVTGPRSSAHIVPSLIAQDLTLTAADGPWRLATAVSVNAGATLTIEPGAVVLADPAGNITVQPGGHLLAGGGTVPAFLVPEDGRSTVTHWGVIHLLAGSGPNTLENVVCDGGGDGAAPAAVTVRSSATVVCQLAVRAAQGGGIALALEAGGTLQTGDLWASDNGGAGFLLDDGAGTTSGTIAGTTQNNAGAGILFLGATSGSCARWMRSGVVNTGNAGGAESGCP